MAWAIVDPVERHPYSANAPNVRGEPSGIASGSSEWMRSVKYLNETNEKPNHHSPGMKMQSASSVFPSMLSPRAIASPTSIKRQSDPPA